MVSRPGPGLHPAPSWTAAWGPVVSVRWHNPPPSSRGGGRADLSPAQAPLTRGQALRAVVASAQLQTAAHFEESRADAV